MSAKSKAKKQLINEFLLANIPIWESEYRFHHVRKWRFDFAWPAHGVALEFEGGVWTPDQRSHTRAITYRNNCEKYNQAQLLGWIVLRYTADMVRDGSAIRDLKEALELD